MSATVDWESQGGGLFTGHLGKQYLELRKLPGCSRLAVFVDGVKVAEAGTLNTAKTRAIKFAQNPLAAKASQIKLKSQNAPLVRRIGEDKPEPPKPEPKRMPPDAPTASAHPPKGLIDDAADLEARMREKLGVDQRGKLPFQVEASQRRIPASKTSTVTVEQRKLTLRGTQEKLTVKANLSMEVELHGLSADEVNLLVRRLVTELESRGHTVVAQADIKMNVGV